MEQATSSHKRRLAAVAVLAGVLLVGGIGVAVAQTGGGSSTTSPSTTVPGQQGPRWPHGPGGPRFKGPGMGGPMGMGGPGGAIHGEFVTPDGSNGYRTVDMQVGQVMSVSSSSITVKSADGFTKTYSVDQNTVVNAGRDGISNVKNGDTVGVNAVVTNGNAAARNIMDRTTLGQIGQHWNPKSTSTTTS
ncbi:MAG: hypothetical protein JO248_19235 [Acidimicrobiia bacterium]|nr:hypothetical protein [Acidimicrobiia bacterium]